MKILHVIPQVWIGNWAAKVLLDLVTYQAKEYSEVSVVTLSDMRPSLEYEIKNAGCKFKSLYGNCYNPLLVFKLIKEIIKYDLIHVHLFPSLYWIAIAKLFVTSNIKFVYTEHSARNNRQKVPFLKYFERFIYCQYDRIIAVSNAVKLSLTKRGIPKDKIDVVYNGVVVSDEELKRSIDREDIDIPDNAFLITQVSRFYPQKDQSTLIRALSLLPNNCYVVFIGDGPLLYRNIELAKKLSVYQRIRFLGARRDVIPIMKASDVIVLSTHYEGFCISLLEALMVGKPVVASKVEGVDEALENAGILCEPMNERDFSSAIFKLMNNNDYYNLISERCHDRGKCFTAKSMSTSNMNIYNNLE